MKRLRVKKKGKNGRNGTRPKSGLYVKTFHTPTQSGVIYLL
jgi:hypothetical protein